MSAAPTQNQMHSERMRRFMEVADDPTSTCIARDFGSRVQEEEPEVEKEEEETKKEEERKVEKADEDEEDSDVEGDAEILDYSSDSSFEMVEDKDHEDFTIVD